MGAVEYIVILNSTTNEKSLSASGHAKCNVSVYWLYVDSVPSLFGVGGDKQCYSSLGTSKAGESWHPITGMQRKLQGNFGDEGGCYTSIGYLIVDYWLNIPISGSHPTNTNIVNPQICSVCGESRVSNFYRTAILQYADYGDGNSKDSDPSSSSGGYPLRAVIGSFLFFVGAAFVKLMLHIVDQPTPPILFRFVAVIVGIIAFVLIFQGISLLLSTSPHRFPENVSEHAVIVPQLEFGNIAENYPQITSGRELG